MCEELPPLSRAAQQVCSEMQADRRDGGCGGLSTKEKSHPESTAERSGEKDGTEKESKRALASQRTQRTLILTNDEGSRECEVGVTRWTQSSSVELHASPLSKDKSMGDGGCWHPNRSGGAGKLI